jgi:hypothetical protein
MVIFATQVIAVLGVVVLNQPLLLPLRPETLAMVLVCTARRTMNAAVNLAA